MSNAKLIAACAAALGLSIFASNDALAAQGGNSKLGQRDEDWPTWYAGYILDRLSER